MKEAYGYITEDGKFFENQEDAEEYEAWISLSAALNEITAIDATSVLAIIVTVPNEIRRYIDANAAANKLRAGALPNEAATRYREIQASVSAKDTAGREANNETVLEQSPRIDESLPDMGCSKLKEEIQLKCKIDGIRSGRVDAPDVRSSTNMAIGTRPDFTKARLNSSTSYLRKGKVE